MKAAVERAVIIELVKRVIEQQRADDEEDEQAAQAAEQREMLLQLLLAIKAQRGQAVTLPSQ